MREEVIAEEQQIAEERLRAEARRRSRSAAAHSGSPMLQPAVTLDEQATVRDAITAMRQEQNQLRADHRPAPAGGGIHRTGM